MEEQAERRAASNSQHVGSGSQRGIRRKVIEMVDKLKSLSGKSVEYEFKILTCFLNHFSIHKADDGVKTKYEGKISHRRLHRRIKLGLDFMTHTS
ncbi:hypothetical protein R1sor_006881 [Riccia sorocarpa]|uniref:Uncharacterized protein n=1 Tax=Riccia sorocarpa TaxID=122646 RepID=A0ABD3HT20_9MARC